MDLRASFGCPVTLRSVAHGTLLRSVEGRDGAEVNMQDKPQGPWEVYFLEQQSNGTVAIRTCHGNFIRATGGEGAVVNQSPNVGEWEQWEFIQVGPGQFNLRSKFHHAFLRAHPGGEGAKADMVGAPQDWERWTLAPADGIAAWGGRPVALRSVAHGTLLRSVEGGDSAEVNMQDKGQGPWEVYHLEQQSNGTVAIRTCHGNFIRATGGQDAVVNQSPRIGEWEQWEFIQVGPGQFNLRSKFHHAFLRAHPGGEGAKADMSSAPQDWERWTLVPVKHH